MTLPWKPVSKEPPFVRKGGKNVRPKVFLFGGEYPVGLDFFRDRHEDRTHWLYRHEIPTPSATVAAARRSAPKKAAPKKAAPKKTAKKAAAKPSRKR